MEFKANHEKDTNMNTSSSTEGNDNSHKNKDTVYKRTTVNRLFHHKDTNNKRVVTIYYEYDREKFILKYGACIFSFDENDKSFSGKMRYKNTKTAENRYEKNPVILENIKDEFNSVRKFHKYIRSLVHKKGVKGKDNKVNE